VSSLCDASRCAFESRQTEPRFIRRQLAFADVCKDVSQEPALDASRCLCLKKNKAGNQTQRQKFDQNTTSTSWRLQSKPTRHIELADADVDVVAGGVLVGRRSHDELDVVSDLDGVGVGERSDADDQALVLVDDGIISGDGSHEGLGVDLPTIDLEHEGSRLCERAGSLQ
jgi:hypothetical protein